MKLLFVKLCIVKLIFMQLMEMKGKAEKYGWDSRYGLLYTQLERKKLRLRHMLYHCYCTYHDPACGNLMDSGMFV
jgi:hypothetical protein